MSFLWKESVLNIWKQLGQTAPLPLLFVFTCRLQPGGIAVGGFCVPSLARKREGSRVLNGHPRSGGKQPRVRWRGRALARVYFHRQAPCPKTSSWVTNGEISFSFGQICICFQMMNLGGRWTTLQVVGRVPPAQLSRRQQTKEEGKGTSRESEQDSFSFFFSIFLLFSYF